MKGGRTRGKETLPLVPKKAEDAMDVEEEEGEWEEEEEEEEAPRCLGFKSPRDLNKYLKQVEESECFDVDYFSCTESVVGPVNLNGNTLYHRAIDSVMGRYNDRNQRRKIRVINLKKCIRRSKGWIRFYMTFRGLDVAKDKLRTYQAVVILVPSLAEKFVLRMLRRKPRKYALREKKHPYDECCGACDDAECDDEEFYGYVSHYKDDYPGKYTLENLEHYYEQLEDSEGFDVDPFPGIHRLCLMTPMQRPWREEFADAVKEHTDLVKAFFSKDKGVQLCDLKVLKVNYFNGDCCSHSYITFDAKEGANGEMKTYQARIAVVPGQPRVEEVRLKPCKS